MSDEADSNDLPREGLPVSQSFQQVDSPERMPASRLRTVPSLTELAIEHEFFTTGVIHAVTPFDRDPTTEYLRQTPRPSVEVRYIDSTRPLFSGLGVREIVGVPVDLDRRLWLVRREEWPYLRDFIAGILIVDPSRGYFAKLNYHRATIVDRPRPAAGGQVEITVFGVASMTAIVCLTGSPPYPPRLTRLAPDESIRVEGAAVLEAYR